MSFAVSARERRSFSTCVMAFLCDGPASAESPTSSLALLTFRLAANEVAVSLMIGFQVSNLGLDRAGLSWAGRGFRLSWNCMLEQDKLIGGTCFPYIWLGTSKCIMAVEMICMQLGCYSPPPNMVVKCCLQLPEKFQLKAKLCLQAQIRQAPPTPV